MEDFIIHPELPPFVSETVQYHIKDDFLDFHNSEIETINYVIDKDPYMRRGIYSYRDKSEIEQKRDVEVEHSMMDFQKLIIGEKIRGYNNGKFININFNHQYLAGILNLEDDKDIDFYKLETVRKLVDF